MSEVIRQGSGEHSCDDDDDGDDLNVIFHLRTREFDCVKKQSISLVNNGCRTVNQKRWIYSKIFRGLCKYFMFSTCKIDFMAKSTKQDGPFFPK